MVTIRQVREEDAAQLLVLRRQLDAETAFMMLEPGERTQTEEQVLAQIRAGGFTLVAADRDRLVGVLAAGRGQFRRVRHSAYIVIGILQAYAGQGIGTRMFAETERWARENDIHRLELTVMTHNAAGVALYKKMGFEVEGTKRDSLLVDGQYVDEYYMAKLL